MKLTLLLLPVLLWGVVLFPIVRSASVRDGWCALSAGSRAAFACVVAGLVAAQILYVCRLLPAPNAAYPFTPWTMYTGSMSDISYYELQLERSDGRIIHYPLERLDRRHHRTVMARCASDSRDPASASRLREGLAALLILHNRRVPDDTAVAIALWRRHQPVRSFTAPEAIPAELLLRVTEDDSNAAR